MHATDLAGIHVITRVLLVYTCQQGVYPRGHVLLLQLPVRQTATTKSVFKMAIERCDFLPHAKGIKVKHADRTHGCNGSFPKPA
jgi:hypothetical protein